MSTSVSGVTSNFFPTAQNGFTTTTSGSVSSGATTVGLNSVAGFSNGEVAVFVIDPTDASKKQTFTGVIDTSGSQVTNVKWTAGTNQSHALGATVVDYETATHWALYSKGLLVEHNQDGTHGDVTATTVTTSGNIETTAGVVKTDTISEHTSANGVAIDGMTIKDGAVVGASGKGVLNSSLGTGAGELGAAWQSWTPTWTNLTVGSGTLSAKYVQIGKTVHFRIIFVYGSGSSVGSNPTFTLPVTHVSYTTPGSYLQIGYGECYDVGVASYNTAIRLNSTTVCQLYVLNGSTTVVQPTAITSTSPFTWASGDGFAIQGTYEAA